VLRDTRQVPGSIPVNDDGFFIELALIGVLIVINGFFAGAEIAIVSAQRGRLRVLADAGNRRALVALRLKDAPDEFLATVQVGITLVGTLASAVGGVAAVERLEPIVAELPHAWAQAVAEPVAVTVVVFSIAYLSLVVGELVPKSLAVRHSEAIAVAVAPVIDAVRRAARPAVRVLTGSSQLVLRLFGRKSAAPAQFNTFEDLRALAEEAEGQGVPGSELITGAFEFHERAVKEVMTPRPRIQALPLDATLTDALRVMREAGRSRYPVYDGSPDNVIGFVFARDVYETVVAGTAFDLRTLIRTVEMVPASMFATSLLAQMRKSRVRLAMVVDEHGILMGLVTLEDLLEVLVGDIQSEDGQPSEDLVRTGSDGMLDADGTVPIHELNAQHGLDLPESDDYVTLAGLTLHTLGTVPRGGERLDVPPYRLTVLAVDGRRITRIRIESV
jgi:putative hemolysin